MNAHWSTLAAAIVAAVTPLGAVSGSPGPIAEQAIEEVRGIIYLTWETQVFRSCSNEEYWLDRRSWRAPGSDAVQAQFEEQRRCLVAHLPCDTPYAWVTGTAHISPKGVYGHADAYIRKVTFTDIKLEQDDIC